MTEPVVTEADRKAAASVAVLVEMRELILSGKADHHAEPFSRHREQAVREALEHLRSEEMVEKAARAMMAESRPNADPDALTPAPRGTVGLVPKWRLFEHLACAAVRAFLTEEDSEN